MFKFIYFSVFVIVFIAGGFKYGGENKTGSNNVITGKLNFKNPQGLKKLNNEQKQIRKQNGSEQNKKDEIDQNWLSTVIQNIKYEEYNIVYDKQTNVYESPNEKNNINFIYYDHGFTAKTLITKIPLFDINDKTIKEKDKKFKKIPAWKINFELSGYKRNNTGSELTEFKGKSIIPDSNKAFIQDDDIKIDYLNNEYGMRQDFTIKNKPDGTGMLMLTIKVNTKLKMIVGADALMFKDRKGKEVMNYSALKAYDSAGKDLRAYFKNSDNKQEFSIIVDDENAQYPVKIDPLSSTPDWTANGENDYDYFGYSVSTAGDVNGDGYSDVIIDAYGYPNFIYTGKVYVYYGSSTGLPTTPNWTATGQNTGNYFGASSSTAGDVNGDGYSDLIIGAYGYNRIYIYHGSPTGLIGPTRILSLGSSQFGFSVSTAGDVNGDGYSDVIIGSPAFSSDKGRVCVYYGSSVGISTTPDWSATGENAGDYFGCSVSFAGDVNGDSYSDVIIGAYIYLTYIGKTYVYYGSSTGLSTTSNWTATGENAGDYFGCSVSTAGDVNGDGFSDVIIGTKEYSNFKGKAYVYYGSSIGLSAIPNWTATGENIQYYFGCSLSTAGDVNGDGYSDVLIGARGGHLVEPIYKGKTYLYYGSSTGLSTLPNWTATGENDYDYFGFSVSIAGDVNGDGYSDIIIGASCYSMYAKGKAYVYYGSPTGLSSTSNWTAIGENTYNYLGYSVSTAGDVNGDGYSDVIIAARQYSSERGKAYVYFGSSTGLSTLPNWTAVGENGGDYFGQSVSTAGDVNGDGYSDIIIGAVLYSDGKGKAYVYQGSSAGLPATPNWTATGENGGDRFGFSVNTTGDVNGDGYSDVVIGATYYSSIKGKAYVYFGSPTGLSTTSNWTATGENAGDYFGCSVSTAGDVNGDGYSDMIIGAFGYSSNKGKSYVYYGSVTGLSAISNWTATGENTSDRFGYYVSTAGDVNGDGYSDVIIGAVCYSSSKGKAYVYHGSSTGLSTPNWTVIGETTSDQFGQSVSTIGDVNGDGYSDVIIASPYSLSGKGKAYAYYGCSTGLSGTPSWTASGENTNDLFGFSVNTTGDVNGDGYSDVIIGASSYSTYTGKVYVYYGNNGTGLRATLQQYKPGTSTVIGPLGLSGANGSVRLNIFAKSPFGRADGKLVYEFKPNNQPFSGSPITNSVSYIGTGSYLDLGTTITGIQLNNDISGIITMNEYKWRVRVQYNPINNPYQKFGPWKYYTNYTPVPYGCFKAQDSPLPVELITFSSSVVIKNDVKLFWTTSKEINNSGFEVQRSVVSSQNSVWEKIIFINGNGTKNTPTTYTFTNTKLNSGKYKYRLKQIDYNGNFEYHNLAGEVNVGIPSKFNLSQNYPNPFNPVTKIDFELPVDSKVSIKVYDLTGREMIVLLNNEFRKADYYTIEFNGSRFSSGVYYYKLVTDKYMDVMKMVLIK
jgi:hypothetical protein